MSLFWKLLTLLAVIITFPSLIQSSPTFPYHQPASAPSPSPSYEEDLSPEPQYVYDEDYFSPQTYAPTIEEGYPNDENTSSSPSPSPNAQDTDDDFYYSPYQAPTPTPTPHSTYYPPPQEDAADLNVDYDEEDYPQVKRSNNAVVGIVLGAVCLVGLGGMVYKNRKNHKQRDQPMYVQLSKKMDL